MTDYLLTTLSADGQQARFARSFDDFQALDRYCRERQLTLLSYRVVTAPRGGRRLSRQDAALLCEQLAMLLESGIVLADALNDVAELSDKSATRRVLSGLQQRVAAGEALSVALAGQVSGLPGYALAMIRAGEQSGAMVQALRETTAALQWQSALQARLWRAVSYPLFSGLLLVGALVFLMLYLVPQLEGFLRATGFTLPWYSEALISFSTQLRRHGLLVLLLFPVLLVLLWLSTRISRAWRHWLRSLLLRLPVVSTIARELHLSRFFHFSGLLYKAGISLPDAIREAAAVSGGNQAALCRVADDLASGMALRAALEASAEIPPLSLRLLAVAERGGRLETELARIAGLHNKALEESLNKLESRLGPAMLLAVGALMVWVIVGVIGPVYDGIAAMGIGL
ncbi:type II secretion system F family protein [Granulosicoccaceae sp. 1_MG-2023]|nr:type II secretion system F family protein [Granulosicoccaceae sp. 1_MG-2023]